MASISFSDPWYLFFLLVIPVLVLIHLITIKTSKRTALKFANFDAIAKIKGIDFFSKNIMVLVLSIFVVLFLVMSLSGLTFHTVIEASSFSFVVAIDTSKSMEADDLPPNRLESAKQAASEFIESLPISTRVGVVSFSGNALIEREITDSRISAKSAVNEIELSEIPGTDIFEAVITGSNLLRGEESRALILLSDGQINVGAIGDALTYANENNILIHTIAVGTEEGGATSFGLSKADEDSLKSLAYNTEGEFFRAVDQEELRGSFDNIIQKTPRRVGIDLSNYMLVIGIILFSVEFFLINSRYRRLV